MCTYRIQSIQATGQVDNSGVNMDKTLGLELPEDQIFDSNCITPATEFMAKLDVFLQDMIARKLGMTTTATATDAESTSAASWAGVKVIYSGHSVPGEGEHKIMQYIRTARAEPSYRANQRHCLYGQDADLLMLGLATHEPHFTILREEVIFKRKNNANDNIRVVATETNTNENEGNEDVNEDVNDDNSFPLGLPPVEFVVPKPNKFQLLHLSVLREYLEVEFCHRHRGQPLDRERLIDDFILLTFLVGNDFLPNLPALSIDENAFDVIFEAYKSLQSEKVEYFITNGEISNFARLEKFLSIIGEQEEAILEKRALDIRMKALRMNNKLSQKQKKIQTEEVMNMAFATPSISDDGNSSSEEGLLIKPSHGGTYQQEYYYKKFSNDITDLVQTDFSFSAHNIDSFVPCLVKEYLKGLMWCFNYYTQGCVSWEWYYPYHYGPMLKDVTDLENVAKQITFNLGAPLMPFQQLLGTFYR